MTNDDLLQQIDKLIQKRITEAVDPIHERLDAQREQINTVEKNLRQNIKEDIKDSEKNIHDEIKPFLSVILDHDEKIEELQKAVGLRPKH